MANQATVDRRQPWINPDETTEAIELMQEAAECMRNTAEFGSMRKELRTRLISQAEILDEFVRRAKAPQIDSAVMLGLDAIARTEKRRIIDLIVDALESFVSSYNRRKQ